MELPVDGSFPDHQQCPAPDPSVQAPYGWQESCMELEMGTATNDLQRMPSAVHYQGPTPPVNPMSPMPNYPQPCSTYPQTFPDCQLHYNEQVMASPRVESWQPNLLNQETWPSFAVQNACYANPPEESPRDRYLAFLQESVPVQTSHNEPVPYPVNPEQMFYPFDSGLKMPTPASTSLGKEHRLMNRGWSSFDESRRPSTTETFQICPNMRLNSVSEWLGAGYQEASSLQFQDVIPRPSHPTFEMDTSKESEHQKPTEPALGHFMQTGMAEVDSNSPHSPLLPVGFEAIGPSNTNLSNPYSSSAPFPEPPFPEPPNICETGTTLHQRSQLLRRTSSTNCCHQLDVWMKPPASDLPISDHVFSLQHSKDNFPATCDPGDSKGVLLPLMVKLVDKPEGNNEEVVALCNMLNMIRAKYPSSMTQSNCGLIRSIVTVFPDELLWVWRFPVTIVTDIFPEPVQTFAYAGSTVEELILRILSDSQQSSEAEDDYVLKLCDAEEVLQNPCTLGSHECLQHYLKLNNDIRLQLLRYSDLQRVLARTVGDDQSQSTLHQSVAIENGACKVSLSRKVLSSKLNSYHHEASSLFSSQKSTGRVVEEVKAICYVLSSVETKEITDAIQQLKSVVLLQTSFHTVQLPNRQGSLAGAINALTAAVSQLVHIYCNNFDTDYQAANVSAKETASVTQAQLNTTRFSFTIYAVHGIPSAWTRSFSDQELRQAAVQQIGTILDDELLDYLPQLVQAVKFEWHLNSPLVEFLLDRSLRSIRVAHQLYWLLKDCLADSQFKGRFSQLLAAVLCGSGQAMREEFDKETKLIDRLAEVAGKVCAADQSKRSTVLTKAIEEVEKFFYQEHVCRLPLNPVFAVKGIDPSACSYFTSNAVPLKISFINADPLGKNINVIYKSGDDLRQDMLVLQIVKVMDRIWCQEGLHMCMIIYRCTSTGRGRATGRLAGLVEMVPGATTLAKIHMKHGIIGPLKENTLSKWFQEHNPTKESHQNAVENFINSCAGWCVATFILGICDRHNDNIMLKTTGHMFHIDFGKFLGHAQMIGRMKRDRAPFIFTSEMAHFITEGGKNGARFQRFVDLSCLAYNIIRQRTQLLMNLLELMLSAGLPELAEVQDLKYVYNNLRPKDSDAQATSYFTSLINESLKSLLVKMNFVAHNLAQMKLAGQDVQPSLSFAPEKHTIQTDSRISSALVCGYEKKIVPHKEYFYKIQVEREGQSEATFIERSFNQFGELNKQLHCCFPASELPRFPFKPLIGLSKGRELARKRKDELNIYVRYLLNGSPQVAKSDLVYTFFHCFPNNERPCVSPSPDAVSHTGKLSASMQLCISWENSKLSVMVKHVKNIFLADGSAPDAYVKIYLLPDVERVTKRKTKVVPKNSNPTYNQILEYVGISSTELPNRVIQLSVWCRQSLLGAVNIPLRNVIMEEEKWYRLGNSLV
uniref:phosphatidylinositol 4-phosphate 3-kinase C2 domain-containing subunit beta-like isoform X10 n=1 Tax=Pristiophorus japonicus TaxID=55135 RepID=UPI00398F1EB9